jgi:hypothetical protein
MVLFELLQLFLIFLDYLRIKYLWHVLIMPLTNRNGITERLGAVGQRTGTVRSTRQGLVGGSGEEGSSTTEEV